MTTSTTPAPLPAGVLERATRPAALVIAGATGDLARRELLPAVYDLAHDRALPEGFALVGVARDQISDEQFREAIDRAVRAHSRRPHDEHVLAGLLRSACYVPGDLDDAPTYAALRTTLAALDDSLGRPLDRCFHLAIAPRLFASVIAGLAEAGLAGRDRTTVRVLVEKPFGTTLAEAQRLNRRLHAILAEEQIFRIDHFLGNETVQNLLVMRFANMAFEPIWNRDHIDRVELTVADDAGVEDRAGYYDTVGALRDVVQSHLLQLLTHVAMEPPVRYDARHLCNEKVKVLQAIRAPAVEDVATMSTRGQYSAGMVAGRPVGGYLDEPGVRPGSRTETFAALRLQVDTWRWAGVPFYLRTGKRLARGLSEIAITLRPVPHRAFSDAGSVGVRPNLLVLTLAPGEGVSLLLIAKIPGSSMRLRPVKIEVPHELVFGAAPPEPYARLILDALRGDPMLFARGDEIEEQWRIVDPVVEAWETTADPPQPYPAGSQGPCEADALLLPGHAWRTI
jgi:glucose-6-phosphate 1-dehydrogenase